MVAKLISEADRHIHEAINKYSQVRELLSKKKGNNYAIMKVDAILQGLQDTRDYLTGSIVYRE